MARTLPPLIGRDRELDVLRGLARRATMGDPAFVLLEGEGGAGKSLVVETFLGEQAAAGAGIIDGGCPPGSDGSIPNAPLAEGIRSLARHVSPAMLDDLLGAARADIARLVPSLAGSDVTPGGSIDSGQSRLHEALLVVLERVGLALSPAILVVEDVQWIDPSSAEFLAFLVRNMRAASVLVIATYRTDELPHGHPLRRRLAELGRTGRIERLVLEPLPDESMATLVAAIAPGLPPVVRDEVVARAGGNPFHAEALASVAAAGVNRLPSSLRELAEEQLGNLSAEAREILRVAAVSGRRLDAGLLTAAVGQAWASEALRDCVRAQVLVRLDEPGDLYRFRHAIVRETILGDLHAAERRAIHLRIAEALDEGATTLRPDIPRAAGPSFPASEVARHWLGAGDGARALPWLLVAAADAERQFAFTEASKAYADAQAILDPEPGPAAQADREALVRRAAEAAILGDDPARAVALAGAIVNAAATESAEVAALDLERLARALRSQGRTADALEALTRAAATLEQRRSGVARLRVHASLGRALVEAGQPEEARRVCREALAEMGPDGEPGPDAIAEVARLRATLAVAGATLGEDGDAIGRLAAARAELARSWSSGTSLRPRPSRIGDILGSVVDLAGVLSRAGRIDEAQRVAEEGADLARALGVGDTLGRALDSLTAAWLYQRGRWDEADRLTRGLLDRGATGIPAAALCLVRARLELARGAFPDVDLQLEAARIHAGPAASPLLRAELHAVAAELAIWRGHLQEARDEVAQGLLALDAREGGLPAVEGRAELCWLGIRAEMDRLDQARGGRTTGEADESRAVVDALGAELAGVMARGDAVPVRERDGFAVLAQAERGRHDPASNALAWATASQGWVRLGEPYPAAYARWREGGTVLAARSSRARAQEAARAAWETARRLDAGLLRRELETLAQHGRLSFEEVAAPVVAVDARTAAIRATGLTARELEVLVLVARGLTNRQVATELFITEKTAGHHVSNLLAKLDVGSRVEAAGLAHRLGLLED